MIGGRFGETQVSEMSFLLRWLRPAHLSNRRFARDEVWLPFLPFHLRAVRMIPERLFFPMGRRLVRYSPASAHLEKGRVGIRLFSHADEACELYAVGRSRRRFDEISLLPSAQTRPPRLIVTEPKQMRVKAPETLLPLQTESQS